MKDYKFRAWYIPGAIMVYQQWSDELAAYVFPTQNQGHPLERIGWALRRKRVFKVMLCTEIKDSNKRDIYEQDIVRRWRDDKELPLAVVEHTPQFWWHNVGVARYGIVGNTFENPELAKQVGQIYHPPEPPQESPHDPPFDLPPSPPQALPPASA